MPSIRITTGAAEYQYQPSLEQLKGILQILNGENTSIGTPDSNMPTQQPADSNTLLSMSEITGTMTNFSTSRIEDLQTLVVTWANRVYPDRTIQDTLVKLLEEVAELFKDPSEEELADVLILTLDLFNLAEVHPGRALTTKMKINIEDRTWIIDPKTGIMRHETL